MEINIILKKENKLLFRTEVEGEVIFEKATPSYVEMTKELSSKLKVSEELVAIKNIKTFFGTTKARFLAYAYNTKENKDKIEPNQKEKTAQVAA